MSFLIGCIGGIISSLIGYFFGYQAGKETGKIIGYKEGVENFASIVEKYIK